MFYHKRTAPPFWDNLPAGAIKYLLSTCATASDMRKVLEDLRNIELHKEDQYRKSLYEARFRCFSVESDDDKIALYVDLLSPTIKMFVAQHYESVNLRDLRSECFSHFVKTLEEITELASVIKCPTSLTNNVE